MNHLNMSDGHHHPMVINPHQLQPVRMPVRMVCMMPSHTPAPASGQPSMQPHVMHPCPQPMLTSTAMYSPWAHPASRPPMPMYTGYVITNQVQPQYATAPRVARVQQVPMHASIPEQATSPQGSDSSRRSSSSSSSSSSRSSTQAVCARVIPYNVYSEARASAARVNSDDVGSVSEQQLQQQQHQHAHQMQHNQQQQLQRQHQLHQQHQHQHQQQYSHILQNPPQPSEPDLFAQESLSPSIERRSEASSQSSLRKVTQSGAISTHAVSTVTSATTTEISSAETARQGSHASKDSSGTRVSHHHPFQAKKHVKKMNVASAKSLTKPPGRKKMKPVAASSSAATSKSSTAASKSSSSVALHRKKALAVSRKHKRLRSHKKPKDAPLICTGKRKRTPTEKKEAADTEKMIKSAMRITAATTTTTTTTTTTITTTTQPVEKPKKALKPAPAAAPRALSKKPVAQSAASLPFNAKKVDSVASSRRVSRDSKEPAESAAEDDVVGGDCPVPGCQGLGHARIGFSTHRSVSGCPIARAWSTIHESEIKRTLKHMKAVERLRLEIAEEDRLMSVLLPFKEALERTSAELASREENSCDDTEDCGSPHHPAETDGDGTPRPHINSVTATPRSKAEHSDTAAATSGTTTPKACAAESSSSASTPQAYHPVFPSTSTTSGAFSPARRLSDSNYRLSQQAISGKFDSSAMSQSSTVYSPEVPSAVTLSAQHSPSSQSAMSTPSGRVFPAVCGSSPVQTTTVMPLHTLSTLATESVFS